MNIRNIAIIAHVDHGKTTLVDGLLKQSKTFRENEAMMGAELIMDSNDQERERGITIFAKNTAVNYKGVKINIIDTPGHADFGGEVERTLSMADGCLLLVDAQEGPMPQTKFVLKKALDLGLKIIVIINKIDKKDARIPDTISKLENLFLELSTHEDHLDFPILFAIGREGKSWNSIPSNFEESADLSPVFEAIIKYVPEPLVDLEAPFQMLVTTLDWDQYRGKYAIGKIKRGKVTTGMPVTVAKHNGEIQKFTVEKVFVNQGLKKTETEVGESGDIVSITGIKSAEIGDTLCDTNNVEALPSIKIEDPTLSMAVGPNTSPFMGKEGKFVTSRQLLERIEKELQTNVAMKFKVDEQGQFILSGRGELHLSVFLETLRREGYEMEVSKPKVITKIIDGVEMEPVEELTVDVATEFVNNISAEVAKRRGHLISQEQISTNITRLVYSITTRGLFGLRSTLLTLSKGTAIASSMFIRYEKNQGNLQKLRKGVLIASETGKAAPYGLNAAQERGVLFIGSGTEVYNGMVVGQNSRDDDMEVNVCKEKHLTNIRSAGADDAIILTPPLIMSLEQALAFIEDDELLEVTPTNLRVRKRLLSPVDRQRAARDARNRS